MTQQSPIFAKTELFMVWLFDHTRKFPKHERFRLAKRIDDALFDFHVAILKATNSNKPQVHLKTAQFHLNCLRTYLRVSMDLKYTTPAQYYYASEHTVEIGKLLGGWNKSSRSV